MDLKEYSDETGDGDGMINGTHILIDHEDSGADTDSSGELLERIQPTKADTKIAQRMSSKDQ